jgi:hypothetical protein
VHGRILRLATATIAVTVCAAAVLRAGPRTWSVTVLGESGDPRSHAVSEAIDHWNDQLAALGSSLRFAPATWSEERLPEEDLWALSEGVRARRRLDRPSGLKRIKGDLVIAFSSSDLISVGIAPRRFGRALVVLRRGDGPPLSLPNVARNVVTHEIGHVLGLDHNQELGTLMCGPPAPCRPLLFRSDATVYFPLTDAERRALAKRWR